MSKRNILQSLSALVLVAIAFCMLPSVLPESDEGMRRSAVMLECRQYWVLSAGGKPVAYCKDIDADTTLLGFSTTARTDYYLKRMVAGCWVNRFSLLPYCGGRIMTVMPFPDSRDSLYSVARHDVASLISRTLLRAETELKALESRKPGLHYYLTTHSVVDEGYNTIAAYAENHTREIIRLTAELQSLRKLHGRTDVSISRCNTFYLICSDGAKSLRRVPCGVLSDESAHGGCVVLRTADGYMSEKAHAVYRFDVFDLSPDRGDFVVSAGIFGLHPRSSLTAVANAPSLNKGRAVSADSIDSPELLTPVGAPLFSRKGFFIGVNNKGRIVR